MAFEQVFFDPARHGDKLSGKLGAWTGPLTSSFGVHLVRLTTREPGRMPALAEVRDDVLREWTNDRRQDAEKHGIETLLQRYDVEIQHSSGPEVRQ